MLITLEFPSVRSESAQTRISKALRFVLYLYYAICVILYEKKIIWTYVKIVHAHLNEIL